MDHTSEYNAGGRSAERKGTIMMDTNGSAALVMREPAYDGLAMVVTPTEAEERLKQLQDFVRKTMVPDVDFGVIPGTDKPTLYQPGAQKLAEIYGFAIAYEDARPPIERWDAEPPFFAYFKKAIITSRRDGRFLGSGIGSCNSRESRYGGRWVFERDVPRHLDLRSLRSKEFNGKRGPFRKFLVPNEEICSLVNTIEKMACKRALVHAVIAVTRSSGMFTQDVEDLPREDAEDPKHADVPDAEYEERPRKQARPSAADLAAKARNATTPDAAEEVLRIAKQPGIRAHAYASLVRLARDPVGEVAARVRDDAALTEDSRQKLFAAIDERVAALQDADRDGSAPDSGVEHDVSQAEAS